MPGACFLGQAVGVAVRPHMGELSPAPPRNEERPGPQNIPGAFLHGVGLAGDKGFVGLGGAGTHHRVGTDLFPGGEFHNVIPHQFFRGQQADFASPHAADFVGGQQGQLVDGMFGPQLLYDADDRVADHHAQKSGVQIRAHRKQTGGQHHEHQVEEGKDVVPQDLGSGLAGALGRTVGQPGSSARGGLGFGQAFFRGGMKHRAGIRRLLRRMGRSGTGQRAQPPCFLNMVPDCGQENISSIIYAPL